jgi:tetratricopeptide (TPR) repeat protein
MAEGAGAYARGDFQRALEAYQRAYLHDFENPRHLERIGDCYRALGNPGEAVRFYKLYLHELPAAPDAGVVRAEIDLLDHPRAPPPRADSTAPPRAPVKQPLYKKWWLWTAVAGGVAAIAIGVGLGVGLSSSPSSGSFSPTLPPFGPTGRASALGSF